MSITLKEAESTLLESVVHGGGFTSAKLRRAIRGSGERLLRETGLSRKVSAIPIPAGARQVDVAVTEPGFLSGHIFDVPFLDDANGRVWPIQTQAFVNVRQLYERSVTAGRPEILAWISPTTFWCYPKADAEYTIHLPWREPLTPFAIDGPAPENVVLNVPRQYADDWLWFGGRAYMLLGAPGHPDAGPAMQEFQAFLQRIKGQVQMDGVWLPNREGSPGQVWSGGGYV